MAIEKEAGDIEQKVRESVRIYRILFDASKRCSDPRNTKALQEMAIDEIVYASALRFKDVLEPEVSDGGKR